MIWSGSSTPAGRGMPAVMIRQLDALSKIVEHTTTEQQRDLLVEQAGLILEASEQSVPQASDRADVKRAYDAVAAATGTIGRVDAVRSSRA